MTKYTTIELGPIYLPIRGRTVNVDDTMLTAIARARAALIVVAQNRRTITYKALDAAMDRLLGYRNLGDMLDILSEDCFRRNEESLAGLVVRSDTHEVGDGYVGAPREDRSKVHDQWNK